MSRRRAWSRAPVAGLLVAGWFGLARAQGTALPSPPHGAPVSPPAPAPFGVTATAERQTLVLGADTGTTLEIIATGPLAAQALPGRARATVGKMGPLLPGTVPGTFTAEYRVPTDRRPQSAILAVELLLPDGRRAHTTVRMLLPAATNFPLRSSPNASVSLEIAGHVFGPQVADADGNVEVPIVVPPDVGYGRARAVNQFGIANQTDVSLQPHDYPRVLLWAPVEAEVGDSVEVEVFAALPSGAPATPEEIDLWAESGRIQRSGGAPGKAAFTFVLPDKVGTGSVALIGSMQDGTSSRRDAIAIHTGQPASLSLSLDVSQLVVGSGAVSHLTIFAQDRFGNLVPAADTQITADGSPLPIQMISDVAKTDVRAPDVWQGRDRISIRAVLGAALAGADVALTGGRPARTALTASGLRVAGDGRHVVDLTLEVFDDRGTPTTAPDLMWLVEGVGSIETLPAPRFGAYLARFKPRHSLRDRAAVVVARVNDAVTASAHIDVEAASARTATARIGVVSNLGHSFGEAASVEGTVPILRFEGTGPLVSVGISAGYLHSEATTLPASQFYGVHVEVTQLPVLALARLRIPGERAVEVALLGAAGVTFALTDIDPIDGNFPAYHASARGLVVGGGADATVILQPGELVIGARYLYANLGRISTGDRLTSNTMGLICDLGFRMAF